MVQLSSDDEVLYQLMSINGIGEKITDSLEGFFSDEDNVEMVKNLAAQLTILPVVVHTSNSPLSEKIVVFTGTLLTMERKEAQAKVESLGAIISSSVSSKTDFLVVGEKPGSKYHKALELDVKILTEEEFYKLILKEKT
ncbi:DNA ligase [Trichonephila clavata]|uniref:DNA ligase n=1 Tax=Trichonephila clavata TaxID=2740835 RepID=A0A8X6J170_TRICU|nr:DNA ligase [Trichonephila clavata]